MSGLVLWDFDGTLAERPGMWRSCLLDVLKECDPRAEVESEAFIPFLLDGFPWHEPDLAHPELCAADSWWAHLHPLLVRAFEGVGVSPARATELASLARARYTDPSTWRVFDDTVPALTLLAERGWRHVVLSNHVPELERIIAGVGLEEHFAGVVCSAVTGYEKPHPEAFACALKLRREGEAVWMVGDNSVADVEGALAAGIPAILVRSNGVGLLEAAEKMIAS